MQTENSVISDELYVSYKLGLEKELEINRQNTADWTEEIETDYSKIFIAHCNDGKKRIVEFVSDSFVVVNGNIRNSAGERKKMTKTIRCGASDASV